MALSDDLRRDVAAIFKSPWTERRGYVIPDYSTVGLDNDAVLLSGTVLYADMADSTKLVDTFGAQFAAEIYKTYLRCAARIIRTEGGDVTAYDGDRVMAVFKGDTEHNDAVRAALKLQYAVLHIVNPAIKMAYATDYQVKHVVGIDTSELFIARTGIRGANDLVWVGRAANHAAKLSALSINYSTIITGDVLANLNGEHRMSGSKSMWTPYSWDDMANAQIYASNYWWEF